MRIVVETRKRVDLLDITEKVREAVRGSGVKEGVALLFSKHTTTELVINEFESHLMQDLERALSNLVSSGAGWEHDRIDTNADAHLTALLLGQQLMTPVRAGESELGAWQRVILVELDGPRQREIPVRVLGE